MTFLIKLSGEALGNDTQNYIEPQLHAIVAQIQTLLAEGHRIALVVGGGNLFRGNEIAGTMAITKPTGHYLGMLATIQNALVLADYFESHGVVTRISSAMSIPQVAEGYIPKRAKRHLEKGRVVIFAGGTGQPFFTTDTCAVQRALEIGASLLVLAKNGVDGVYDADPNTTTHAQRFTEISCSEILERELRVADNAAIALARENNLPMKVVAMDAIARALDETVGTTIIPK